MGRFGAVTCNKSKNPIPSKYKKLVGQYVSYSYKGKVVQIFKVSKVVYRIFTSDTGSKDRYHWWVLEVGQGDSVHSPASHCKVLSKLERAYYNL